MRQRLIRSRSLWLLALLLALTSVAAAIEPADRAIDAPEAIAPTAEVPPGITQPPPGEIPIVEYDVDKLPPAVREMRQKIIDAATSGDPEALRPVMAEGAEPPLLSFGDVVDPIAHLRSLSGDREGREILAILIEVLEAGYVHVDVGTPDEMYVWPYFARMPIETLNARQMVELFRLVYAGDYQDMLAYGHYTWFRAGIAPDGTWRYFIAGD